MHTHVRTGIHTQAQQVNHKQPHNNHNIHQFSAQCSATMEACDTEYCHSRTITYSTFLYRTMNGCTTSHALNRHAPCCTELHHLILHHPVLNCITPYRTLTYRTIMYCHASSCTALHHPAPHYMMQTLASRLLQRTEPCVFSLRTASTRL